MCEQFNRKHTGLVYNDQPGLAPLHGRFKVIIGAKTATKSVPDSMFLPFCRRLENQVESKPRLVLGAILMADGGARTAEAAGTPIRKIKFYDNYAIVDIQFQEKGGKRIKILKSKPSYRITVLSRWGAWMARRCIEKLGWDEDTEDLITTGPALSAWVRKELEKIDSAFIARAAEIEATNPDVDDDGHEVIDVSAYVLRRNAASRWLNIDGLTHDEIDMLLGHKRKITGGPELYLTDETHQQSIAKKLYQRYCPKNFCRSKLI